MESLYLLIPLSVVLVFGILLVFAWSLGNGQFDDLEAQGRRVVDDDDSPQSDAATSISETAKSTPDSGHHAKSSKP
jgi:cbb3-type cytochrome oxidase maturation protein